MPDEEAVRRDRPDLENERWIFHARDD